MNGLVPLSAARTPLQKKNMQGNLRLHKLAAPVAFSNASSFTRPRYIHQPETSNLILPSTSDLMTPSEPHLRAHPLITGLLIPLNYTPTLDGIALQPEESHKMCTFNFSIKQIATEFRIYAEGSNLEDLYHVRFVEPPSKGFAREATERGSGTRIQGCVFPRKNSQCADGTLDSDAAYYGQKEWMLVCPFPYEPQSVVHLFTRTFHQQVPVFLRWIPHPDQ